MTLTSRLTGLIGLLLSLIPSTSWSQVETHRLDNGLEIVVIPDHRAPVVTNMVWYRIGSADEPPGKSGIAHYLEHLMFKGTDEIPEGQFSQIVSANGGQDNAFTSYDYTGYFQRIAADRLPLVMRMEADRMTDLIISEAVWVPERDVILEERRSRVASNPSAIMAEQRDAALYLNHPYGTPIIGWEHEMSTLTRQDALDFYARYYAPNNAILIVAGDVTLQEVVTLAEEYFGDLPPSDAIPERIRPQEPVAVAPRRLVYADPRVQQPYVIRSYLAPERNAGAQQDAAALTILAELLGGGPTSVLYRALVVDAGIAVSAGAFYSGTSLDPTSFGLYAVPADGVDLEQAEAALDAAIADFMQTGPDAAHLDRIKVQVRASEIFARDSQEGLARAYGAALTSGLTVEDVDAWPAVLDTVTAEDIVRVAQQVLDLRQSVTAQLRGTPEPEAAQ